MPAPPEHITPQDAKAVQRTTSIIAYALILGMATFGIIVAVMADFRLMPAPPAQGEPALLGIDQQHAILLGTAIFLCILFTPLSFLLRAVVIGQSKKVNGGRCDAQSWTTAHLIALSLVEGYGLFGAVIGFISQSMLPLALTGFAVIVMLIHAPTAARFRRDVLGLTRYDNPFRSP